MVSIPKKAFFALLPFFLQVNAQASGSGTTTRYWDCCKPSCSWPGKISLASGAHEVATCNANDNVIGDFLATSSCGGGDAYMCTNQSPVAINDTLAYGYAAVHIADGSEASWCCACYELTFTSGPVAGKKMVVQATNTGGDLGNNHFDLSIPGGGFGIFDGCTKEFGTPNGGWGDRYGGVRSRSQCDSFPAHLKDGCYFRFDWFKSADNPTMDFKQVSCPAALTEKTGCKRADDGSMEVASSPGSGGSGGGSTPSPPPPPPSPVSGTAAKYGQCGGIGWTGPAQCVAGTSCRVQNSWYSQCL